MINYRPDIDGLRGVAVLLVLLYHAGLPYITGGFVGVDIFFVISGYLITTIIVTDVKNDNFSFSKFYERRIRRILPAFYVVAIVVFILGILIQIPSDLLGTSESLIAALFFSSNLYFWRTTDYFSESSDYQPFLHTWSLGVEEQFYFLFPVFLLFCLRHRRALASILFITFALSLALSEYATHSYPWAAYYLLPSRAWQLMAGALIAIYGISEPRNALLRYALIALCLASLFLPPLLYTKNTAFPGLYAVAPTLGAALAIVLGRDNDSLIHKFLANKLLVGVGLISYSLYLWHWPVFAFIRAYQANVTLDLKTSIAGIVLSLILAYLSWRFVERPFRNSKTMDRIVVYKIIAATSALIVLVGGYTIYKDGLPQRLDPRITALYKMTSGEIEVNECMGLAPEQIYSGNACLLDPQNSAPAIFALWGDSHASSLKKAFADVSYEQGVQGIFLAHVGCGPLPGVINKNFYLSEQCYQHHIAALDYLANHPTVETIFIHARWALSVEGTYFPDKGDGMGYVLEDRADPANTGSNLSITTRALARSLDTLYKHHKRVVLIGPVPEVEESVPRVMANNIQWAKNRDIRPTVTEYTQRQKNSLRLLKSLQSHPAVKSLVLPHLFLCDEKFCEIAVSDQPLYFDNNHLTKLGAELVADQIDKKLFFNKLELNRPGFARDL